MNSTKGMDRRTFLGISWKAAQTLAFTTIAAKFISGCSPLTGPDYGQKVDEKEVKKGIITPLGPFNVRLVGVVVENEAKGIKKATLEFLDDHHEAYFSWKEFNLNDSIEGLKLPDKTGDFKIQCIKMPPMDVSEESIGLYLSKKSDHWDYP